jgi:hypothetical protein
MASTVSGTVWESEADMVGREQEESTTGGEVYILRSAVRSGQTTFSEVKHWSCAAVTKALLTRLSFASKIHSLGFHDGHDTRSQLAVMADKVFFPSANVVKSEPSRAPHPFELGSRFRDLSSR